MNTPIITMILALAALPSAVLADTYTRRSPTGAVTGTLTEQAHPFSNGNPSYVERDRTGRVEQTYTRNGSQDSYTVRGPSGEYQGTTGLLRVTPMSRNGDGR